jgi:DNA-binding NtrC family response regulator
MIETPSVIWVGSADGDDYRELSRAIRRRGLGLAHADTAQDLPNVLSSHARAVVVACDRQTQQRSRDVVASLSRAGRRVPILVLVEEADFSDYYDLMERGVRYYYEFREGAERISGALSQAVSIAAA